MRFEDVADLLPGLVDGTVRVDEATQAFIESDLRCQAELARYRKLLRTLEQLRTRYLEPSPGLLAATLTALAEEGERRVVHSIITGKRLAYAGAAIGGARIMALAMESAPAQRRGRAMASYSTALPLSNGVGALINGIVVDLAGFRWMYTIAGILCAAGFVVIWRQWAKLK